MPFVLFGIRHVESGGGLRAGSAEGYIRATRAVPLRGTEQEPPGGARWAERIRGRLSRRGRHSHDPLREGVERGPRPGETPGQTREATPVRALRREGPEDSGFTTNFTEGGVHIQTNRVMSPGTQLHIEIHSPHQTFGLRARVVWARRRLAGGQVRGRTTGMGLEILEPGPEWIEFCRRNDIDREPTASGSR